MANYADFAVFVCLQEPDFCHYTELIDTPELAKSTNA